MNLVFVKKGKALNFQNILTHGLESWAMTERVQSQACVLNEK